MSLSFSVILTVFNDEKEIKDLLENIFEQSLLPNEIIVADGGSKDKTVDIVKSYNNYKNISVKVIWGNRLNISQGLNAAIKMTVYDYIAIVATGNFYEKEYFEKLNSEMQSSNVDIVYPLLKGLDTTKFSKVYNKVFFRNSNSAIPTNHGLLCKRILFEKIGYFYEKFIYAGEDEEYFLIRARQNGIKTICCKSANVFWDTPSSLSLYSKQVKNYTIASMQIYDNQTLFFKKYRDYWFYISLLSFIIIASLVNTFTTILKPLSFLLIIALLYWVLKFVIRFIIKFGVKGMLLKNISMLLVPYYIIKFRKYMSPSYKLQNN